MIFLSNIEHCVERKKKPKAKWDAIQTELQIMKNDSLRSWPHDARAEEAHTDRQAPTQPHLFTHSQPHICMCICRTFATHTLNEASVGRTPSAVLRNPIKVQKDIKSFSPFNKVDLFVVCAKFCLLDSTVIS